MENNTSTSDHRPPSSDTSVMNTALNAVLGSAETAAVAYGSRSASTHLSTNQTSSRRQNHSRGNAHCRRWSAVPQPPPYYGVPPPQSPYYGTSPSSTGYGSSCAHFSYAHVSPLPPTFIYAPLPPPPPSSSYLPRNQLRQEIINQIDYYFCDDNLAKDFYLKSKMDDNGWVPIEIIASFRRVTELSNDSEFVLDCMRYSHTVEVGDRKLRRYGCWNKWVLPPEIMGRYR